MSAGITNEHPTAVGAGSPPAGVATTTGDSGVSTISGSMHPAPSLTEAPPKGGPRPHDPLSGQHSLHALSAGAQSPLQGLRSSFFEGFNPDHNTGREPSRQSRSASPRLRKDTLCSTSTNATTATNASQPSNDTAATSQSIASSPTAFPSQNVFSVNDGSDMGQSRQKRRRTGPLNPEQRVKAALIRKHGACDTCHKRRVACDPSHHNLTWDDLKSRYAASSPSRQQSVPVSPHGWNPTNASQKRNSEEADVEIEPSPSPRSEQTTQKRRTPLPRGPRLLGTNQATLSSPTSPERSRPNPPGPLSRIYTIPDRGRYSSVEVLLLFWADDRHSELPTVVNGLRQVLSEQYNSTCAVESIPPFPEPSHSYRWLSDRIRSFARHNDQRDVLKIVYYNGHAYLDRNRDMVLANSVKPNEATEIRWKPIQADLEESLTDTLIIMDCPYFGDKLSRRRGILEVLASNTYDDYVRCPIPRCAFTKALIDKLRAHAAQASPRNPLCATDLHAHLMSEYPKIIRETRSDDEVIKNFPSPSHLLVRARDTMAASIELTPLRRGSSPLRRPPSARQLNISLQIGGDADLEMLMELFRFKPDTVRQVQIEDRGPLSAIS